MKESLKGQLMRLFPDCIPAELLFNRDLYEDFARQAVESVLPNYEEFGRLIMEYPGFIIDKDGNIFTPQEMQEAIASSGLRKSEMKDLSRRTVKKYPEKHVADIRTRVDNLGSKFIPGLDFLNSVHDEEMRKSPRLTLDCKVDLANNKIIPGKIPFSYLGCENPFIFFNDPHRIPLMRGILDSDKHDKAFVRSDLTDSLSNYVNLKHIRMHYVTDSGSTYEDNCIISAKISKRYNVLKGDKLIDRHGNKYTVSSIEEDLFFEVDDHFEEFDIVVSPNIDGRKSYSLVIEEAISWDAYKCGEKEVIIHGLPKKVDVSTSNGRGLIAYAITEHKARTKIRQKPVQISEAGIYTLISRRKFSMVERRLSLSAFTRAIHELKSAGYRLMRDEDNIMYMEELFVRDAAGNPTKWHDIASDYPLGKRVSARLDNRFMEPFEPRTVTYKEVKDTILDPEILSSRCRWCHIVLPESGRYINLPVVPPIDLNNGMKRLTPYHAQIDLLMRRINHLINLSNYKNVYIERGTYDSQRVACRISVRENMEAVRKHILNQVKHKKKGIIRNLWNVKFRLGFHSVVVGDPSLPVNTISVPSDMKKLAKVADMALVTRFPVHDEDSCMVFDTIYHEGDEIRINPGIIQMFDGDFDGDELHAAFPESEDDVRDFLGLRMEDKIVGSFDPGKQLSHLRRLMLEQLSLDQSTDLVEFLTIKIREGLLEHHCTQEMYDICTHDPRTYEEVQEASYRTAIDYELIKSGTGFAGAAANELMDHAESVDDLRHAFIIYKRLARKALSTKRGRSEVLIKMMDLDENGNIGRDNIMLSKKTFEELTGVPRKGDAQYRQWMKDGTPGVIDGFVGKVLLYLYNKYTDIHDRHETTNDVQLRQEVNS